MPTVIHIITGLDVGGAERSLYSLLAGGLAGRGMHHVVSLTDQGVFGPRIASLGVPVHSLGLRRGRQLPGAVVRPRRLLHQIRPDLLQGWMYHGNLAAWLARLLAPGRPALVWNIRQSLDNLAREKPGTHLAIRLGRSLSAGPDTILYNCTRSRDQHESFGYAAARARVIPNGFDTSIWQPDQAARAAMRARLGIDESNILIGFVGRFHWMKDLPNLLRALAPLMGSNQRIHLAVVGRGNERDNPMLVSHYAALPSERLHILGQQTRIHTLMPGFDIFCLSSRSEAFPNVLGEAMACGLPCVATDVGDSALLVADTGVTVPPSDSEALYRALRSMISLDAEARLALGAKARTRICNEFSLDAAVRAYAQLYDRQMKRE